MKYIRTLKNIEKLMNAKPNYVTKDVRFGTEYITYSDTRYEITIEKNDTNMWIMVNDRDNHTRQYYDYFMTEDGWQFDKISSRVTDNKELNEKLKWDLVAIKDGHYEGKSFQEYELSKDDTKTILDMVYSFTDNEKVVEIVKALYADFDNLDARITYKHTTVYQINIISGSDGRNALQYFNYEWNAYQDGLCIYNLRGIPEIDTYVLYDNFNNPYLERDRVRPLPGTETTKTVESIDQVENDQISIKKWPTITTDCQPEILKNISLILPHDKVSRQGIKRAPPGAPGIP